MLWESAATRAVQTGEPIRAMCPSDLQYTKKNNGESLDVSHDHGGGFVIPLCALFCATSPVACASTHVNVEISCIQGSSLFCKHLPGRQLPCRKCYAVLRWSPHLSNVERRPGQHLRSRWGNSQIRIPQGRQNLQFERRRQRNKQFGDR